MTVHNLSMHTSAMTVHINLSLQAQMKPRKEAMHAACGHWAADSNFFKLLKVRDSILI
jgi:hypothetical protein